MEKGLPADAHDAGSVAVELTKGVPADAQCGGVEKGFPADAHDAGVRAVEWIKGFQLMLMMLGSWRWSGKRFSS